RNATSLEHRVPTAFREAFREAFRHELRHARRHACRDGVSDERGLGRARFRVDPSTRATPPRLPQVELFGYAVVSTDSGRRPGARGGGGRPPTRPGAGPGGGGSGAVAREAELRPRGAGGGWAPRRRPKKRARGGGGGGGPSPAGFGPAPRGAEQAGPPPPRHK